jgi:DNA-binding NtrC family response regulator
MARILLVEDQPDVREVLCEGLTKKGYPTTAVATLAEGEWWLGEAAFDVLVTDVMLPDGYGTVLVGPARQRGVRTILMSGYADLDVIPDPQAIRLRKPFALVDLIELLTRCGDAPAVDGPGDEPGRTRVATLEARPADAAGWPPVNRRTR